MRSDAIVEVVEEERGQCRNEKDGRTGYSLLKDKSLPLQGIGERVVIWITYFVLKKTHIKNVETALTKDENESLWI